MMRVRLSELELHDLGAEIWDDLQPRAEAALARGAEKVVEAARANLAIRRGTRRTAAPAGEAPEYDTGELHDSMKVGAVRRTRYGIRQEYGSDHPSAGLHEFGGTVTTSRGVHRYPPRPYMRPAEEQTRAEVESLLEEL